MENIISGPIGLFHAVSATIAVSSAAVVLFNRKGTKFHKTVGYIYVVSMLAMNLSAFGIYRLFGGFGVFHVLAIVSLCSLASGMYPVFFQKHKKDWYIHHLEGMSWSAVGLYAALAAEIGVRFFEKEYFFWIVGISTAIIMFAGARLINRHKAQEMAKLNLS